MTTLDSWAAQATPTLIEFAWQEMESRWFWRGAHAPNAKDQDHSALFVATAILPGTYLPFLAWLIKQGADVTVPNPDGKSVLFPALWHGDKEVSSTTLARLQILLDAGADPNMADAGGISPLMVALDENPGAVHCLLKAGARVDWVSQVPLEFRGPRHTPMSFVEAWLEEGAVDRATELQALLLQYALPSAGNPIPARRL